MKKFLKFLVFPLLSLLIIFNVTSCGESNSNNKNPEPDTEIKPDNKEELHLSLKSQSFVYDGNTHRLEVEGYVPSDIQIDYENNDQVNAGQYEVVARVIDKLNKYQEVPDMHATLIIEKANFDISHLVFESKEIEYDGQPHSLFIEGNLPDFLEVSYSNNEMTEVGTYEVTANFTTTNKNYNVPKPLKANLIINESISLDEIIFEDHTFTFNGKPHSLRIKNLPKNVRVEYENNSQTEPGKHKVVAKFYHKETNKFLGEKIAYMTIEEKGIDIKDIYFVSNSFEYDGLEHEILLNYVPDGYKVTYFDNKQVNAGHYDVRAVLEDINNPSRPSKTIYGNFDISPKDISTLFDFQNQTITYDGLEHTYELNAELPNGVTLNFDNYSSTEAGEYYYEIIFDIQNNNYAQYGPINVVLTIEKARLSLDDIQVDDVTTTYDGNMHYIDLSGIDTSKFYYDYSYFGASDAGVYDYSINLSEANSSNYYEFNETLVVTLTIEPKVLTKEELNIKNQSVTYDGWGHLVTIEDLPYGVSFTPVEYREAGKYDVLISLDQDNKNYVLPDPFTIPFEIYKANYEIDKSQFIDQIVEYNGYEHYLELYPSLPSELTVEYENLGYTNVGTYPFTVNFTNTNANYNDVDPITINLIIEKNNSLLDHITFDDNNVTYNGSIHNLYVSGLPLGLKVTYTNNDKVNAGVYTVTAHFIDEFNNFDPIPDKTATLTINKADLDIYPDYIKNTNYIYDGTNHPITIDLSDNFVVTSDNNNNINADEYLVKLKITDTNGNYNDKLIEVKQIIEKVTLSFDDYIFEDGSLVYDGNTHKLVFNQELPSYITFEYTNDNVNYNKDAIDVGEYLYQVKLICDNNHKFDVNDPTLLATLNITPATFDYSDISLKQSEFTYDLENEVANLELVNVPEGFNIFLDPYYYDAVGTYDVNIKLTNKNYKDVNFTLPININRIKFDINSIYLEEETVVYDGNIHTLTLQGDTSLLNVTYQNNNNVNAGVYDVICNIEFIKDVFEPVNPLTATLTILKADYIVEGSVLDVDSHVYDGQEHTPRIEYYPSNMVKPDYTRATKVKDAGVYEVTIPYIIYDSENYNEPLPFKGTYTVYQYDLNTIKDELISGFKSRKLSYSGNNKKINFTKQSIIPSFVEYSIIGNNQTEPGIYDVMLKFNLSDNIIPIDDLHATLTIVNSGEYVYYHYETLQGLYHKKYFVGTEVDEVPEPIYQNGIKYTYSDYDLKNDVKEEKFIHLSEEYEYFDVKIEDKLTEYSTHTRTYGIGYNDIVDLNTFEILNGFRVSKIKIIDETFENNIITNLTHSIRVERVLVKDIKLYYFYNNKLVKAVDIIPNHSYQVESYLDVTSWKCLDKYYNKGDVIEVRDNNSIVLSNNSDVSFNYLKVEKINSGYGFNIVAVNGVSLESNDLYIPPVIVRDNIVYNIYDLYSINNDKVNKIQNVIVEEGIVYISHTFENNNDIINVHLPDTIKLFDNEFQNTPSLKKVRLPKGIDNIPRGMFKNSGLEEITIPETVRNINNYAFSDCKLLNKVNLNKNLLRIGACAFSGCEKLSSITFNEGLTSIYSKAFENTKIKEIILPSSVRNLESSFIDMPLLEKITIKGKLNRFFNIVEDGNTALKEIYYDGSIDEFMDVNAIEKQDYRYVNFGQNTILYTKENNQYKPFTQYTVKKDKFILGNILNGYTKISNIFFEDGVTKVPDYVFKGLKSSTISVNYNSSVNEIGEGAFLDANLTAINLPEGITKVNDFAFKNVHGIDTISLPKSITYLGKNAFYIDFDLILKVNYNHDINGLLKDHNRKNIDEVFSPYNLYKDGKLVTSITITENDFDSCTLFNNLGIKVIIIADNVTTVKGYSFGNLKGLQNITLPKSLTTINNNEQYYPNGYSTVINVFYGGSQQDYDNIIYLNNDNNNLFGMSAIKAKLEFNDGSLLTNVKFNKEFKNQCMFNNITTITSLTIDDSITVIKERAFTYLIGLKSLKLPANLVEIKDHALCYHTSDFYIDELIIPASLKTVGIDGLHLQVNVAKLNHQINMVNIDANYLYIPCELTSSIFYGTAKEVHYSGSLDQYLNMVNNSENSPFGDIYRTSEQGNLFVYDKQMVTDIVIPDNITTIKRNFFTGLIVDRLTTNKVNKIEEEGINNCNIKELNITNKDVVLESECIAYVNIKTLNLPEGLTTLPTFFLSTSKVDKVYLPKSINTIENFSFDSGVYIYMDGDHIIENCYNQFTNNAFVVTNMTNEYVNWIEKNCQNVNVYVNDVKPDVVPSSQFNTYLFKGEWSYVEGKPVKNELVA